MNKQSEKECVDKTTTYMCVKKEVIFRYNMHTNLKLLFVIEFELEENQAPTQ